MRFNHGGCLWSQLFHPSTSERPRPEMQIAIPNPTLSDRQPRKKALLIGVSSSQREDGLESSLPDLCGPHRDVEEMEKLLRESILPIMPY
jgi:hypothetical protein